MIDNRFGGVWPVCSGDLFVYVNNDLRAERDSFILTYTILIAQNTETMTYLVSRHDNFELYIDSYPGVFYRDRWRRISLNETKHA